MATCNFNEQDFYRRWSAGKFACVIAVDGGLERLESTGCKPDVVIGDFDSLGYVPDYENVLVHPTHKDKSDLELALDYVAEEGYDEAVMYGALGGRLDHTVANLQMCARFAEAGIAITLVDLDNAVRILVGPATYELPVRKQGTVSVFSAVDETRGVTERGLEYPLKNAVLSNRTTLGLSNELIDQPASVSVEYGTLFIFHPLA